MIKYNIKYDLNDGQGWISFESAGEGFVSAQYNRGTLQGHWDGEKLKGQFIDTVSNGKGLIEFSFNETGFDAKWKAGIEEGPMKGKWVGKLNSTIENMDTMDQIKITINGRINTWVFNSLKDEYFEEFNAAFEEFASEPFESFGEFLNELILTTFSNPSNDDAVGIFRARFDEEKIKVNCPLLEGLLNDIEANKLSHYDLYSIISTYPIEDVFFISEDSEINISKNTNAIIDQTIQEFLESTTFFEMEEFEDDNQEFIVAKNKLIAIFNQNESNNCFMLSEIEQEDFIETARIGIDKTQIVGGVKYCTPNLLDHYLNYDSEKAFSIRHSNYMQISYEFEANSFDLSHLTFLKLKFIDLVDDCWTHNDSYAFSEIFYNNLRITGTQDIQSDKGIRLYFDGEDSEMEANFKFIVGDD
jgi:hypothetical protein